VAASVHQIGDGTWGLFPDQVFLKGGETYTARGRPVCADTRKLYDEGRRLEIHSGLKERGRRRRHDHPHRIPGQPAAPCAR